MMNSLAVFIVIAVSIFSNNQVAAQEAKGPGIVIARPGQDVELLCTLGIPSTNQRVPTWIIGHRFYGVAALKGGILDGYSADDNNNNSLIIQNIVMNDRRNDTEYQCVFVLSGTMTTIVNSSDPTFLYVAGPPMMPNVTVDNNTNGSNLTLTLSWGEPFNNLDPIVNYTVSCSGDVTCPPSYTTTDNTTRSCTITDLKPDAYYVFSVVATNSIGSGEAGVVTIGNPPATTVIPTPTTTTVASSVGTTTITSIDSTSSSMSSQSIKATTSLLIESSFTTTILSTSMTSTISNMSAITTTTTDETTTSIATSVTATSSPSMTNNTATEHTTSTTTSTSTGNIIIPISNGTPTLTSSGTMTPLSDDDEDETSSILPIIIVIIVIMLLCCCVSMSIVFCCCCARKEKHYEDEKFCADPRNSFIILVVLGVLTFGITILIWYIYLKNEPSTEKDKYKYYKITSVSIFVLGIYTCGISVLLWWMYKGIRECSSSSSSEEKKDLSAIPLSSPEIQSPKANEVPSASNKLAERYQEAIVPSPTDTIEVTADEEPSAIINEMYEEQPIPTGYAVVDMKDVIARQHATASAQQVQHQTMANGDKYAIPDQVAAKNKPIKYAELQRLPASGRIRTTENDAFTPYAELS